jgi:hypothetical protein
MDRIVKISIAVAVLGAMAYFCYSLLAGWYEGNIEAAKTQPNKKKLNNKKRKSLSKKFPIYKTN